MESPDELHSFFGELRAMLGSEGQLPDAALEEAPAWEPLTLEPASPLGVFVRRCLVAFEGLLFEGACRLYAELLAYVEPDQPAQGAHPPPNCTSRLKCFAI